MYVKLLVPAPSTLSGVHGVSCCNSCTTFSPTESLVFAVSLIYFMMRKQPRGIQGLWIKPWPCLVAAGPEGLRPKASHTVQWRGDLPHPWAGLSWILSLRAIPMALDLFPLVLMWLPVPFPVFHSHTISPTSSLPLSWQCDLLSLSHL